jgi:hypothetical protein
MKRLPSKLFIVLAACLCVTGSLSTVFAAGARISGRIMNGTTGRDRANGLRRKF